MNTTELVACDTNATNVTMKALDERKVELNLYYAAFEVLVAIFAVVGNALVIFVFRKERRLRRRTNYYIVSLAAADLLVGLLGIPFAILSSVGLPVNLHACLFTVSLLIVLCTISIFCLVAVSVDRYWAILHPMGYSRNVRTKTALVIISICWFAGSVVGFLPLMGWHKNTTEADVCFFLKVMDLNYLAFLYFVTIITPALLLAAFYAHIYQVVLKQLRQIVTMNPEKGSSTKGSSGGTMIRILGVQQTNEVKATQNLAIIVLFFMICWIPLYTINCILAFRPDFEVNSTFMLFCIILSHVNSAGNPLLYAYHLRDFRAALKNFFCDLFVQERYCEQIHRNNYNYSQYNIRLRKKSSSASAYNVASGRNYKVKMISPEKVNNSTAACGGDLQRTIWNISEHSNSSSESMKSLESCAQDKILMIRPATPYRPRTVSELNPTYTVATSVCDDSDDGFNEEETLPYHDYALEDCELETCLTEKAKKHQIVAASHERLFSTSSPQLSRGLFFVEPGVNQENDKTVTFSLYEPRNACPPDESRRTGNFTLSPFRMGNGVFGGKKELNRSLSDGGNVATSRFSGNGAVKSFDSYYNNS